MSTATTTSHDTGQQVSPRGRQREAQQPVTQQERSAANRLRATMAAVKLSFTWLGVRKTLAPEQRTTAARAFHADRELLSASKLILDTKNPAYRAVAAVKSEASSYWRTVTLPFPEAGIRLLPQSSLSTFASTMQTYRERLQEAARELVLHDPERVGYGTGGIRASSGVSRIPRIAHRHPVDRDGVGMRHGRICEKYGNQSSGRETAERVDGNGSE